MLQKLKYFVGSKLIPNRLFLIDKGRSSKSLYLTFDDGPVPEVTTPLLELLGKYQVKATFFIVRECAKVHSEVLTLIHQKGHALANHTFTHLPFHKSTMKQKIKEVVDTNILIKNIVNEDCKMFRAPQGRWDMRLLYQLSRLKIPTIHWSCDSMDFMKEKSDVIIKRFVINPMNPRDILLFHDDVPRCIEALDILIPKWQTQGYTLEALEQ
ncbi:polysaccharide deacetylase family protein [Colwellia sp. M166]|uniref:polysaccharide deacetylase family protein n=1 Tax=Colwellia sp. M166 TaxID=2583805 RepID=UPI00211F2B2E|nr:polysaccharide deacetylase family protein [Colwellia sp. M166]UUO23441.1 polysaccharide deacetylase family protein [Colwellia sp. M166]|tara:strand:+ start:12847 stop:13479 length:633 start_codon:yes stop_codon:yes gene_type:complete